MRQRTFYRVWWALGGYKHYDERPDPTKVRHPDPKRAPLDEAARIDRVTVIYEDNSSEYRANQRRMGKAPKLT